MKTREGGRHRLSGEVGRYDQLLLLLLPLLLLENGKKHKVECARKSAMRTVCSRKSGLIVEMACPIIHLLEKMGSDS